MNKCEHGTEGCTRRGDKHACVTAERAPEERPTGWTTALNPISADQLGRQPPPRELIINLPQSRFMRAGIETMRDTEDDVTYQLWFEVDTNGQPFVFKHELRLYSIEGATNKLGEWLKTHRFGA